MKSDWEDLAVAQFTKDCLIGVRDTVSYAYMLGDISQEVRDKFHRSIDEDIQNVYRNLGVEYKEEEEE